MGDGALLEAARNGEYDRALAALLSPAASRTDLLALAAFGAELDRILPATRREPHMAEIRLQWWREALDDVSGPPTGHPVADALRTAARHRGWSSPDLVGIIDAHAHDGLADAFADDDEFMATLKLGEGTMFRLAATALGAATSPEIHALSSLASVAYGLARRLVALPNLVALGHVPLPQSRLEARGLAVPAILAGTADVRGIVVDLGDLALDRLAQARKALAQQPRRIRLAFLPLALVETYVRLATAAGRDSLRGSVAIGPTTRMGRLTMARVLGRP